MLFLPVGRFIADDLWELSSLCVDWQVGVEVGGELEGLPSQGPQERCVCVHTC